MRKLLVLVTLQLLKVPAFERLIGFLAWQRRRHLRRQVERRLKANGSYPCEVIRGPFSGMRLPAHGNYLDARFEKTFGAYEPELFHLIEELGGGNNRNFQSLLNIGAADGFYAIGLARLIPGSKIIGFEPQKSKQETLLEIARINGISDRLELHGECTPQNLSQLDTPTPILVFCDVDGAEESLLDPSRFPWLREADILVETHDFCVKGITETLKSRFSKTHSIEEIPMRGINFASIPILKELTMTEIDAMVGSERPSLQSWLYLQSDQS